MGCVVGVFTWLGAPGDRGTHGIVDLPHAVAIHRLDITKKVTVH